MEGGEWSHPPALTCNSIFLCGHSMCVQLLELPVELLQFRLEALKLTVQHQQHSCGWVTPLVAAAQRLFDLQFPLNLLPEKGNRILYTLLELRVHEVTFSQTPQTAALLCSSNIEKSTKINMHQVIVRLQQPFWLNRHLQFKQGKEPVLILSSVECHVQE